MAGSGRISSSQFESYVEDALASVPTAFRKYLENIVVVVEEEPAEEDYEETDKPMRTSSSAFSAARASSIVARWSRTSPGMITFRAAENIRSAAAGFSLEAMLVEADTPYLSPAPYRGRPCEPAYVVETARKLAEVKATSQEAVASAATGNSDRLFAKVRGS